MIKSNRFIILLFFLLLLLFEIYNGFRFRKSYITEFREFYNKDIHGKLSYISASGGVTSIELVGSHKTYRFMPIQLDSSIYFSYFAKGLDSIIKPAQSDTLRLIRNNKVYKYLIRNPH